jgi:hypothetical protein
VGGKRTGATLIYAGRCLKVIDKFRDLAFIVSPNPFKQGVSLGGDAATDAIAGAMGADDQWSVIQVFWPVIKGAFGARDAK